MENLENLSSENSFSELYNAYYFLQLKNNEVPLLKKFTDIKKGIMQKLEDKLSLNEGKSKNKIELFSAPEIMPQNNSGKMIIKNEENNLIEYENGLSENTSTIKSIIKNKSKGIAQSKDFLINLNVSYEKREVTSSRMDYHREFDNIGLMFEDLNLDKLFGLYYVLHDDAPEQEFFDKKNGWGLRLSEFPEVKENINRIRQKHGIKTPRALEKTIEEEGRHEENKRMAAKLNYAIIGERELFQYLNKYSKLNFNIDLTESREQMLGIYASGEDVKNIAKFEYDKFNKNLWTGKLEIIQQEKEYNIKNVFLDCTPGKIIFAYREYFDIEEICANVVEKFSDKGLLKNLRIGAGKKYY